MAEPFSFLTNTVSIFTVSAAKLAILVLRMVRAAGASSFGCGSSTLHSITWSAFLVRLNFLIEIDGFEGRYTLTRCNLALLSARSAHETSRPLTLPNAAALRVRVHDATPPRSSRSPPHAHLRPRAFAHCSDTPRRAQE